MAYPDLKFPINIDSGLFNTYQDASSTWCENRRNAKGLERAYQLMLEWGLAKKEGKKVIKADCGGLSGREYEVTATVINGQEARRLAEQVGGSKEAGCEILENMYFEALEQKREMENILGGNISGKSKDNHQIALRKWTKVSNWLRGFTKFQGGTYEDGTEMDTCTEEGLASLYDDAANKFRSKIDEEGAPLPNSLLIGIIGVSTLLLGFVIYKITK